MGGKQKRHKYKQYTHDISRSIFNSHIRWNRRLLVSMFHPDHISQVALMMTEAGKELSRISLLKSLTRVEKLVQVHWQLDVMAGKLRYMKPADPRQKGGEDYEYQDSGYQNIHGLQDLDEIINNTLGEEDERGDFIMQNKSIKDSIQRQREFDAENAHFKHNQPPEEKDGSNAEGNEQEQPPYVQSLSKNRSKRK